VTSYTQKLNAFNARTKWTVESDGVRWEQLEKEKKSGFIPIEKIKAVRLRYEPSRAETRRVGLHIYAPYDHPITNIDYAGVMDFEVQEDPFREFAIALHEIFPADTKTTFHSGSTMAAFIFNIAITVLILVFLLFLAPLVSVTGIPGATSIFRILMILIFLPILFKMLKKNRPQAYRPDQVPMEMLRA